MAAKSIFFNGQAFWEKEDLAFMMASIEDDDSFIYAESEYDTGEEEGLLKSYTQINTFDRVEISI